MALQTFTDPVRALVVGGTAGIGAAIALELAKRLPRGSIVTIAGRNKMSADDIISTHQRYNSERREQPLQGYDHERPDGSPRNVIDYVPLDATLISNVRAFSEAYIKRVEEHTSRVDAAGFAGDKTDSCPAASRSSISSSGPSASLVSQASPPSNQLDILVLSPSAHLPVGTRNITPPESIDKKMALHYYARMSLIRDMIDREVLSDRALVVSVMDGRYSDAHSRMISWDDLDLARPGAYKFWRVAAHTLGMTDVILEAFADKAWYKGGRTFIHAYPGIVNTRDYSAEPWYARWTYAAIRRFAVEPRDYAVGFVNAVDRLSGQKNGDRDGRAVWNIDGQGRAVDKKTSTEDMRRKVWEHTWRLVDAQRESRSGRA